jgi:hypothetical protein
MMRENHDMLTIKQLVQDDRYRVDPYVVADAIMRRLRGGMPSGTQKECSKPESSSSASTKQTPGSPAKTDPIQVKPALG